METLILLAGLLDPQSWLNALWVAVGLGVVIFIHELGHFLAAKACGVKVEKFMIGFDIGGWKLSWRWGETEYGIGILPLGGYVKMLGQEDNPYRIREEMERARRQSGDPNAADETPPEGAEPPSEQDSPAATALDPRSYLAKPVPARMLIISAGVIMNVLLAFVLSTWAFNLGVPYPPAVVGQPVPGGAAWEADLRPGDEIIRVNDVEHPQFRDLQHAVAFGDPEQGVELLIRRPGRKEPFLVRIKPKQVPGAPIPLLGLTSASDLVLADVPVIPGTPAADATPEFAPGDRVVAINGQAVENYADLQAALVRHTDETIRVEVERAADRTQQAGQRVPIKVAPNRMRRVGLVMALGEIVAVRKNSPAAQARARGVPDDFPVGLRPGDLIVEIRNQQDDQPLELDPVTLPEQLRRLAGQAVTVVVSRQGNQELEFPNIVLEPPRWVDLSPSLGSPIGAPGLGICYRVVNRVVGVVPGSPAARDGSFAPGKDEITRVEIRQPPQEAEQADSRWLPAPEVTIPLGKENPNWPQVFLAMQDSLPGARLVLYVQGRDEPVELEIEESSQWHYYQRGFIFRPLQYVRKASSFGESLRLGLQETWQQLTVVIRFLQNIGRLGKQIGGPITIFRQAAVHAERGFVDFILFLALLSANLAVLNSLPIPVLDGGHFVFLLYEGIRGKPVSERVYITITLLGFFFILGLIVLVTAMDISRLFQ